MIVSMNEDIKSYEHKAFGNFTKRQLVCGGLSLLVIAPSFALIFWNTGDVTLAGGLSAVFGIPVLFFSIIRKDGQPLEVYLRYQYMAHRVFPRKRKYEMTNLYEDLQKSIKESDTADETLTEQKGNGKKSKTGRTLLAKKGHRTKQHPVHKNIR